MCCICCGHGSKSEMATVTVEVEAEYGRQRWWAHPHCIRDAMNPKAITSLAEGIEHAFSAR